MTIKYNHIFKSSNISYYLINQNKTSFVLANIKCERCGIDIIDFYASAHIAFEKTNGYSIELKNNINKDVSQFVNEIIELMNKYGKSCISDNEYIVKNIIE